MPSQDVLAFRNAKEEIPKKVGLTIIPEELCGVLPVCLVCVLCLIKLSFTEVLLEDSGLRRQLEAPPNRWRKKIGRYMFIRFVRIHERDRQTDRHTYICIPHDSIGRAYA